MLSNIFTQFANICHGVLQVLIYNLLYFWHLSESHFLLAFYTEVNLQTFVII